MTGNETRMMSTQEAADRKGCTRETIRYAISTGKLNGRRFGKVQVVYLDTAFNSWSPNPKIQKAVRERWANANISASS